MTCSQHFVQYFAGDTSLTDAMTEFIGQGFVAGDACVVIVTLPHRTTIDSNLIRGGFDLAALAFSGDYIPVDANSTLYRLVGPAGVDRQLFLEQLSSLLEQGATTGRAVRICGEMVALLAEQGRYSAALEIEEMCNELSGAHAFNMFCAYPLRAVLDQDDNTLVNRINAAHDYSTRRPVIESRDVQ